MREVPFFLEGAKLTEENKKAHKETSFKNDLLFAKLVENKEAVTHVLNVIFNHIDLTSKKLYTTYGDLCKAVQDNNKAKTKLTVTSSESQFSLRNDIGNKDVTLDNKILVNIQYGDDDNVQQATVNLEMQRRTAGASINRLEYHIASIITHDLQSGENYDDITPTFCIFFIESDKFSKNYPIYHIKDVIDGTTDVITEAKTHKIYINLAYKSKKDKNAGAYADVVGLINDLKAKKSNDITNPKIREVFHYYVETKEGAEKMGVEAKRIYDNGFTTGFGEGEDSGKRKESKRFIQNMLLENCNEHQIVKFSGLPENVVRKIINEIKNETK